MAEAASEGLATFEEGDGLRRRLVSTSLIPKGTRIFSEAPLVTMPRLLYDYCPELALPSQVKLLSQEKQDRIPRIRISPDGEEAPRDYFPCGLVHDTDENWFGYFLKMYHVSHSCIQNAHRAWNPKLKKLTLHAIRDIAAGEEITVNRTEGRRDHDTRAATLNKEFHVVCSCPLCSLPINEREAFDDLFHEITVLSQVAKSTETSYATPLIALDAMRKLIQLLQRDDFPGLVEANFRHFAWIYQSAASLAMTHSDVLRGKIFAKQAAAYFEVIDGSESPATKELREAALDPKGCSGFGYTEEWNTEHEVQPTQDDMEAFDRWLWRRDDRRDLQFADLRSQLFFPTFQQLPVGGRPSYGFHRIIITKEGREEARPFKNWCFIGEIVSSDTSSGLEARVIDKTGQSLTVKVPEGKEKEFKAKRCGELKPGHTIAVLYAFGSTVQPDQEGIWLLPPRTKIFPLSLDDLLSLSDSMKHYGTCGGEMQVCHGCEKHSTDLKPCPRCGLFWYCNQDCLAFAWKARGHKQECKDLQNKTLKNMFLVTWGNYEYHFMFPLQTEEETELMREAIELKLVLDKHEKARKEGRLLESGQ